MLQNGAAVEIVVVPIVVNSDVRRPGPGQGHFCLKTGHSPHTVIRLFPTTKVALSQKELSVA